MTFQEEKRNDVSLRFIFVLCCLLSIFVIIFYSLQAIEVRHIETTTMSLPTHTTPPLSVLEPKLYGTLPNFQHIWQEYFGKVPSFYNCSAYATGNTAELLNYTQQGRIPLTKEPKVSMNCSDIQRRVMGNAVYTKLKHPSAMARNVYKDYHLQEVLLAFSYSPSNIYCYAVDQKSDLTFKENLKKLETCLSNVFVLEREYSFDSAGHYQDDAHTNCAFGLLNHPGWEYVHFLQNDDIFMKTPDEISDIIGVLKGASVTSAYEQNILNRIPNSLWTAQDMNLFKNLSAFTAKQYTTKMTLRKSPNQMFLPRTFMQAVLDKLNMTTILELFNSVQYGGDEMLYVTLLSASYLNLPGQIETKCNIYDYYRYVHWNWGAETACHSQKVRHGVCLIGMEYMPILLKEPHLIANKIWPEWDFGTIMCIGEVLSNRTARKEKIVLTKYKNMPQITSFRYFFKDFVSAMRSTDIRIFLLLFSAVLFTEAVNYPNYRNIWKEYYGEVPSHYNCKAFVAGDKSIIDSYDQKGRIPLGKIPKLSMTCEDVRRRVLGDGAHNKLDHPFALARNIFSPPTRNDYYIQEFHLATSYSPYNVYCYALDQKSNETFKQGMRSLKNCFENIFVLESEYAFDSSGHFQDHAHTECTREMLKRPSDWQYVLLLQNHDIMLKTPEEISDVIGTLNGTSFTASEWPNRERVPSGTLTPKALSFFVDEDSVSENVLNRNLVVRKGPNQMMLPRALMEALEDKVNIAKIMDLFNTVDYGVDEMLYTTLVTAYHLKLPGQFQNKCDEDKFRYVHWSNNDCKSGGKERHHVCMLGIEYLPKLMTIPHLIGNKIWPEWDFGTMMCIAETLYNRTNVEKKHKVDLLPYINLPQVREMKMTAAGTFDPCRFRCDTNAGNLFSEAWNVATSYLCGGLRGIFGN